MRRILPALLLSAAACSDSGTGPALSDALTIHVEAERVREATVAVGDSVQLTARSGSGAHGGTDGVVWRTDDPSVVRLSGASGATAFAHGVSFGSARVIATAGSRADTVVLSVLGSAGGECGEGGGLELALGQSHTTTAAGASQLCIAPAPGAGGDAVYLVVPFHAAVGGQRLRVEVAGEGIRAPASTVAPPAHSHAADRIGPVDVGAEFDRRLREREAAELTRLVRPAGTLGGPRLSTFSTSGVPSVGDTLTVNVNSQQTCTQRIDRRARVRAVSERGIFLEDTGNPTGGFTDGDYQSFASAFDQLVYPTITSNFGAPSDIDGNGRVLVLFSRAVNELTAAGSDSYVAGFFYGRDLFPTRETDRFQACAGSNAAEILYMLAPDPTGAVNGNVRTREFLLERTVGVLAHELQHLINASRRLHVVRGQNWNEEFWLNEGLSHIAEELIFYATTPYAPGQGITINMLRNGAGHLSRYNQYQVSNAAQYSAFLRAPEDVSPIRGNGLATRGAAWAFLRYAADRHGGSEDTLWRRLVDADVTGYTNLVSALGTSPLAWLHDWSVSLYTDDLVSGVPSRFRQPSWNHRSVLPALSGNSSAYPLRVTDLRPGQTVSFDLQAAGSASVRMRVPAGGAARLRLTSGGTVPPPDLRVTIVRVG